MMNKIFTLALSLILIGSMNAQTSIDSFPIDLTKAINLKKLITNDTILTNVKEFNLLDTANHFKLIDNYGFISEVESMKGEIVFKQYVLFFDIEEELVKECFAKFKLTVVNGEYSIKRINDIDFDKVLSQYNEENLSDYDLATLYFLGCLGTDSQNFYKRFVSLERADTFRYFHQLFQLGITNHPIHFENPILINRKVSSEIRGNVSDLVVR